MRFQNRSEFINKQASEKLTLAHVHGRQRLYVFNAPVNQIYSKVVPHFVYELQQDETKLSKVNSIAEIVSDGQFYYDIKSSTLYARFGVDPQTVEIIATYRFFFSTGPIQMSWDLTDSSSFVNYDARIIKSPGYKHKIGIDQALTSLVGSGVISLVGSDGDLDEIFDQIIFENQRVEIYSHNRTLKDSEARVIYRGRITNKSFDTNTVSFTIKDQIFDLLEQPDLEVYSDTDNVADSVKGQYKRRVYGRVDGLRCQSTDQIASGYAISGTVAAAPGSTTMTGTLTQFLTETFEGDKINVGIQEFEVQEVINNTELVLNDEPDFAFTGQEALLVPDATNVKNRTYIAAGHVCAQVTKTVVDVRQLNRVVLNNTDGLFAGDFIEFVGTGERIQIKNTAPGNIVVLIQNMINRPAIGSNAIRRPIQQVYIGSQLVPASEYSVINGVNCGIAFTQNVEFLIARVRTTPYTLQFTNGSRDVQYTAGGEISLEDTFAPRDWIKPDDPLVDTFFQISSIENNTIKLTQPYSLTSTLEPANYKKPAYLTDDSIVSVNILGKTEDGQAEGVWISTVAQAERDLIEDVGISVYNDQSFVTGQLDANQLISIAIPEAFDSKSLPTVKQVVDQLNKSVSSSVTLDNDLLIKYQVLNAYNDTAPRTIDDFDVIDWKIKTTNGKAFRNAIVRYRFSDVDLSTLESGSKVFSFESEFIRRYLDTNKTTELDIYLYRDRDAEIAAHRNIYQNRLSVSTVSITTDLRMEDVEIGQVVVLDFQRMYKRFGDQETRKKAVLVTGKTVTGESIKFEMSDLGNTFNTSSYITPNDAPCYADATEDEKIIYGFITDNQGIVDNEEDTAGVHLIS